MKQQLYGLMGLALALLPFASHAACTVTPDGKQVCDTPAVAPAPLSRALPSNPPAARPHPTPAAPPVSTPATQPVTTPPATPPADVTPPKHEHSHEGRPVPPRHCVIENGQKICTGRPHHHHEVQQYYGTVIINPTGEMCAVNGIPTQCPQETRVPILMQSGCVVDGGYANCQPGDKISINRAGVVSVNTIRPICVTNFIGQTYCTPNADVEHDRYDQINCSIGISNHIYCYRIEPVTGFVCITDNNLTACYDPRQPGTNCQKIDQSLLCSGIVMKTYAGLEP